MLHDLVDFPAESDGASSDSDDDAVAGEMGGGDAPAPAALLVEEYAARLVDYSNQYGSEDSFSYAAVNCLGKPTKFPSYGDFAETFVLREIDDFNWSKCPSGRAFNVPYCRGSPSELYHNFVDLRFHHRVAVNAIYIYETFNPGSVVAIWGGDARGGWSCLWSCNGSSSASSASSSPRTFPGHHPRAFSPPLQSSPFPVCLIRIVFCHSGIPGNSQIDAVGLLGTVSASSYISDDQAPSKEPLVRRGSLTSNVSHLASETLSLESPRLDSILELDLRELGRSLLHRQRNATDDGPFFGKIPNEILVQILSNLDLPQLFRCASVCRSFRRASSAPRLFTRLSLKHLFHLATDRCLRALSPRCALTTHLDLSWCGGYSLLSPLSVANLLSCCGLSLTHLRLNNCPAADAHVVRSVALFCPRLRELGLSGCRALRPEDFLPLTKLCDLRALNLSRTRVGQPVLSRLLGRARRLRHLRLSSCGGAVGDDVCRLAAEHCPELQSLELWRCPSLTARGVAELARLGPALRELDVGWCAQVDASSGCFVHLAQHCNNIERLILSAHRQLSNLDVLAFSSRLAPSLRQLDLVGTRLVGAAAVAELLKHCRRLELLDLDSCEQMASEEARRQIGLWRRKYPKCRIIHSFP